MYKQKKGPYGTLFWFEISYKDKYDPGSCTFTQGKWAYDAQHAIERFFDSEDGDGGWQIVSVKKARA